MKGIAAKLWASMIGLILIVLILLGLIQVQVLKWSYYRHEALQMISRADRLAYLLTSGGLPRLAYLLTSGGLPRRSGRRWPFSARSSKPTFW